MEDGTGGMEQQLAVPVPQKQLVPEQLLRHHAQHSHETLRMRERTVGVRRLEVHVTAA